MHEYYGASDICMNSYGASNICMNIYGAFNICMNTYRAFIEHHSYSFIIYGFHSSVGWISTPALRQKLRIGQTRTIAYN